MFLFVSDNASCQRFDHVRAVAIKEVLVYYLRLFAVNNELLYKIGISNRTVGERFYLRNLIEYGF
jgi:hypothetical protein